MRILFLTHTFNSLTQRLHAELTARGHEISVEFDIADSVAEEAVELFRPDLILAPYLRRAIPESIWKKHLCLIVHPGIVGDRGPSALDWAIMDGEAEWGVTVLQAEAEMDAGPIWATEPFKLRPATKASLYRNEVTEAACLAVLTALERIENGLFKPLPLAAVKDAKGSLRPLMRQVDRAIDWQRDGSATVLAKLRAADGFPGVADLMFGEACHLFDAHAESVIRGGAGSKPGDVIGRRETALLRATVDGAVWIGHVKRSGEGAVKLPAAQAFAAQALILPELPLPGWWAVAGETWQDIRYQEAGEVGFLHFD
ncbi:MAG TPA: formyltransferase family protein, partial [Rhodocyclaceae bacterium]